MAVMHAISQFGGRDGAGDGENRPLSSPVKAGNHYDAVVVKRENQIAYQF